MQAGTEGAQDEGSLGMALVAVAKAMEDWAGAIGQEGGYGRDGRR